MITRTEERRDTNWIAMIRLADGTEIPCTVKDVSKSGARLGVPSKVALPDQFKFKVLGRDFVCSVKVAWRRGEYVGVVIEQVGKLKAVAPKEERAPAKEAVPVLPETSQPLAPNTPLQARRSRFYSQS